MLPLLSVHSFADETWTVKPAGGGDYTALQDAETAKDGDLTGRGVVTFECYTGGDLGIAVFAGWTNADADNYPRVYVPLAERHEGKDNGAGAYMYVPTTATGIDGSACDYLRIEGLRFECGDPADENPAHAGIVIVPTANYNYCLIDSNLIIGEKKIVTGAPMLSYAIDIEAVDVTITEVDVWNNIIYNTLADGILVLAFSAGDASTVTMANLYSNSIHLGDTDGIAFGEVGNGASTVNGTIRNNIVTSSNVMDYCATTVVNGTLTGSYNLSSDDSGDDWGATGAQINKAGADQFVNVASDWNLKGTADALHNGLYQAEYDWDAVHLDADDWRPPAERDIGALERADWVGKVNGVSTPERVSGKANPWCKKISGVSY